jgi:hypothetical protein
MQKINNHVARLHRYLPFTPAHDQIYEEYQKSADSLNIATRAYAFLEKAVEDRARLIVLTGDAGHGKTYLCRSLLQEYLGCDEDESRNLVNSVCDGSKTLVPKEHTDGRLPLRVFKDLSELDVDVAASAIENALAKDDEVTIVCANEGRLQAVLGAAAAGARCKFLAAEFRKSFHDGLASRDGKAVIVNLNFQSVASERSNLSAEVLNPWLHGNRWSSCDDCSSRQHCPILWNRTLLSGSAGVQATRKQGIQVLFSTLERLGEVITIRELLMMSAYMLTGGLTCKDVHERVSKKQRGWQHAYAFYNLIFSKPDTVSSDILAKIPVALKFRKLDPGRIASRNIDENVLNNHDLFEPGQLDLVFGIERVGGRGEIDACNGIDELEGHPRSRRERRAEAEFILDIVRSLRRRDYFDGLKGGADPLYRLGFDHGREFLQIISGSLTPQETSRLKNLLVAGLHTLQGLQARGSDPLLHLVDPAFGKATSHAAIIARKIPNSKIKLYSKSGTWSPAEGGAHASLVQAVDWIERYVVLRVTGANGSFIDLDMNLMAFDCICRAARGFVSEDFYAHDARRIRAFLAKLAEIEAEQSEEILLFLHGRLRTVSLDGGVVQVSGDEA